MSAENIWDRAEVIRRYCGVGSQVQRHLGFSHAADCFCGNNRLSTDGAGGAFRYSEDVLAFVEDAVRLAIQAAEETALKLSAGVADQEEENA